MSCVFECQEAPDAAGEVGMGVRGAGVRGGCANRFGRSRMVVVEGKLRVTVKGLLSLSFVFCHLLLNSSSTISKAVDIHGNQ